MIFKLKDENLEGKVSGGYTFSKGDNRRKPFEVIDDYTGEVVKRFSRFSDAKNWARDNGFSTEGLDCDELQSLREDWKDNDDWWW